MGQPGLLYTVGVALFAAIGTFLFGFDTGIATTTVSLSPDPSRDNRYSAREEESYARDLSKLCLGSEPPFMARASLRSYLTSLSYSVLP